MGLIIDYISGTKYTWYVIVLHNGLHISVVNLSTAYIFRSATHLLLFLFMHFYIWQAESLIEKEGSRRCRLPKTKLVDLKKNQFISDVNKRLQNPMEGLEVS
jgi:hypothetical protein